MSPLPAIATSDRRRPLPLRAIAAFTSGQSSLVRPPFVGRRTTDAYARLLPVHGHHLSVACCLLAVAMHGCCLHALAVHARSSLYNGPVTADLLFAATHHWHYNNATILAIVPSDAAQPLSTMKQVINIDRRPQ
ncbi:hypothetical protein B296_00023782 [Ensete ventricosum]|uniref:Uncharacterized protein n=1 Tax=Ensete ventricosum TaxID=4639 RepID=A0A426ZCF9_ENSVE|nr:hypothetical protein B296_00023782 [Ensete ventricosum]